MESTLTPEDAVRQAVSAVVAPAIVESVHIVPDPSDSDVVEVTVHVGLSNAPMPSDILLRIIDAAGESLERKGEGRFPAVFAHFMSGQRIEAA